VRTVLLTALLAACGIDRTNEVPTVQPHGTTMREYLDGAAPKVDVLFVIDSSPAMAPYLPQVQQTMQLVAARAETRLRGPRANLHVGVVTADMTAGGGMRHIAQVDGAFMLDRYTPTVDQRNYHDEFETTMMALTAVGTAGADRVQPLDAIRAALDHNASNAGFLRDDAALAIVVLAAEDDASAADPAATRAFVKSLKADPDDAMIAVAAPDTATRLATFAAGTMAPLSGEGVVDFIFNNACVPDASGEGYPFTCLDGELLDSDATTPGLQPTCTVTDAGGVYQSCDVVGATPCWRISTNNQICGSGSPYFTIDRGADDPPTLTNLVSVECVTR